MNFFIKQNRNRKYALSFFYVAKSARRYAFYDSYESFINIFHTHITRQTFIQQHWQRSLNAIFSK